MSLFDMFRPEKRNRKFKELKITLQLNPLYFKEIEEIKLKRELSSFR
jgi:hypothetical protein